MLFNWCAIKFPPFLETQDKLVFHLACQCGSKKVEVPCLIVSSLAKTDIIGVLFGVPLSSGKSAILVYLVYPFESK